MEQLHTVIETSYTPNALYAAVCRADAPLRPHLPEVPAAGEYREAVQQLSALCQECWAAEPAARPCADATLARVTAAIATANAGC